MVKGMRRGMVLKMERIMALINSPAELTINWVEYSEV